MTPVQKENFLASMETMRSKMHEIIDNMVNNAIGAGLIASQLKDEPVPINNLPPDPARRDYTKRNFKTIAQVRKTKVCPICERELPLGQFRSSDNHLHDECNQCREEREIEKKTKKNKAS